MRIDEQGRWVSDDGYYVWNEDAQEWVPANQAGAGATPGGAAAGGAATDGLALGDRGGPSTQAFGRDTPSTQAFGRDGQATQAFGRDSPSFGRENQATQGFGGDAPAPQAYGRPAARTPDGAAPANDTTQAYGGGQPAAGRPSRVAAADQTDVGGLAPVRPDDSATAGQDRGGWSAPTAAPRTTAMPGGGYGETRATSVYGNSTTAFGGPAGYQGDASDAFDASGPPTGGWAPAEVSGAGREEDDDDGRRGRPAWLLPAGVAVLVVLVAGGLFLALHGGGSKKTPTAAGGPTVAASAPGATRPTAGTSAVPSASAAAPSTVPSRVGTAPRPSAGTSTTPGVGTATGAPASRRYTSLIQQAYLGACESKGGNASYCGCTLTELEVRYTQSQFLQLNENPQSSLTKQVINRVARDCISKY